MSDREHHRRIIERASETITEALRERKEKLSQAPVEKPKYKPLTEVAQLERQVYLANLALNKYETRLEEGDELTPEEERVFLSHQDSLRKLEVTLSALRAKADPSKKTDEGLAIAMLEAGMPKDVVRQLYPERGIQHTIDQWEESK